MARHKSIRKSADVSYATYTASDQGPIWDGSVLDDNEALGANDVRTMARMYMTGVPVPDIAYIFKVGEETVIHLIKRHLRIEAAIKNRTVSQGR